MPASLTLKSVCAPLRGACEVLGYHKFLPLQAATFAPLVRGASMLLVQDSTSPTVAGKTVAYLLALLQRLHLDSKLERQGAEVAGAAEEGRRRDDAAGFFGTATQTPRILILTRTTPGARAVAAQLAGLAAGSGSCRGAISAAEVELLDRRSADFGRVSGAIWISSAGNAAGLLRKRKIRVDLAKLQTLVVDSQWKPTGSSNSVSSTAPAPGGGGTNYDRVTSEAAAVESIASSSAALFCKQLDAVFRHVTKPPPLGIRSAGEDADADSVSDKEPSKAARRKRKSAASKSDSSESGGGSADSFEEVSKEKLKRHNALVDKVQVVATCQNGVDQDVLRVVGEQYFARQFLHAEVVRTEEYAAATPVGSAAVESGVAAAETTRKSNGAEVELDQRDYRYCLLAAGDYVDRAETLLEVLPLVSAQREAEEVKFERDLEKLLRAHDGSGGSSLDDKQDEMGCAMETDHTASQTASDCVLVVAQTDEESDALRAHPVLANEHQLVRLYPRMTEFSAEKTYVTTENRLKDIVFDKSEDREEQLAAFGTVVFLHPWASHASSSSSSSSASSNNYSNTAAELKSKSPITSPAAPRPLPAYLRPGGALRRHVRQVIVFCTSTEEKCLTTAAHDTATAKKTGGVFKKPNRFAKGDVVFRRFLFGMRPGERGFDADQLETPVQAIVREELERSEQSAGSAPADGAEQNQNQMKGRFAALAAALPRSVWRQLLQVPAADWRPVRDALLSWQGGEGGIIRAEGGSRLSVSAEPVPAPEGDNINTALDLERALCGALAFLSGKTARLSPRQQNAEQAQATNTIEQRSFLEQRPGFATLQVHDPGFAQLPTPKDLRAWLLRRLSNELFTFLRAEKKRLLHSTGYYSYLLKNGRGRGERTTMKFGGDSSVSLSISQQLGGSQAALRMGTLSRCQRKKLEMEFLAAHIGCARKSRPGWVVDVSEKMARKLVDAGENDRGSPGDGRRLRSARNGSETAVGAEVVQNLLITRVTRLPRLLGGGSAEEERKRMRRLPWANWQRSRAKMQRKRREKLARRERAVAHKLRT